MPQKNYTLDDAARKGFIVDGATRFYTGAVMDAAPVTAGNTGVPVEMTTYFDPKVVEILTRPLRARRIAPDVIKGDATTTTAKFSQAEPVGATAPYSDFSQAGHADSNANWVARDAYLFQTIRQLGDLEIQMSAEARINLEMQTQRAAALILDTDCNKFAFNGVAGRRNYGLLNDPGLNATIAPTTVTAGTTWDKKTAREIFADVLKLYSELVKQMGGNDQIGDAGVESPLILALSSESYTLLGTTTDYGVTALDMVKNYFQNIEFVTAPEYVTTGGKLMQLILKEYEGQRTVETGQTEKFHAFPIVRQLSGYRQKFRAGTLGALIYRPAAIAGMLGI